VFAASATRDRRKKNQWDLNWSIDYIAEFEVGPNGADFYSVKYTNIVYKREMEDGEFVEASEIAKFWRRVVFKITAGFKPRKSEANEVKKDLQWAHEVLPDYNQVHDHPLLDLTETTDTGIRLKNQKFI
jgi:hypothetical protein